MGTGSVFSAISYYDLQKQNRPPAPPGARFSVDRGSGLGYFLFVALAEEDIDFIKAHIGEWLVELSMGKPPAVYEVELRERMVRVEEELKHQRELMLKGFEQVDKRIESMQEQMNKRFEQVDKRFEQMDRRFEQVDKRFESIQEQMDRRFDALTKRMDRFMVWSFGVTISVAGIVIAVLKFT